MLAWPRVRSFDWISANDNSAIGTTDHGHVPLDTAIVDDTAGCGHLDEHKHGELLHSTVSEVECLWDHGFAAVPLTMQSRGDHDHKRRLLQASAKLERLRRGMCWARIDQNPGGDERRCLGLHIKALLPAVAANVKLCASLPLREREFEERFAWGC